MVIMKQYEKGGSAPVISANDTEKKELGLKRQVKDLTARVSDQQKELDRMHRDIVRLRVTINDLSAKIKN